jgi:molybdopterin molybdotransferase
MCASVYIKAWVNASLKQKALVTKVKLGEEISFTPPLTYFLECSTQFNDKAELVATPFIGHGSGDFANLAEADGFVILPENQSTFKKGDVFDFVSYRTQF